MSKWSREAIAPLIVLMVSVRWLVRAPLLVHAKAILTPSPSERAVALLLGLLPRRPKLF